MNGGPEQPGAGRARAVERPISVTGRSRGPVSFGESPVRQEDSRLLRGSAAFASDIPLPGALHAAFVRSPHAHALLGEVDVRAALAMPGVVAAFTGRDLAESGVEPIPSAWRLPGMRSGARRAIATDRVRFEGEAVAVVIATTAEAAQDAAEYVTADYEPLPSVWDVVAAAAPGAPTVYDDVPGNLCFDWSTGDSAATDSALADAVLVVRQEFRHGRVAPLTLEPHACAALCNAGHLTLHTSAAEPHLQRLVIGTLVLGMPEHHVRVVSRDTGGDFDSRLAIHAEDVVVCWVARRLDRPVRWTGTREESFLAGRHGRDHSTRAVMGFDGNGRICGLRVETDANLGAGLSMHAAAIAASLYGTAFSGPYDIPAITCSVRGIFSHTAPVDGYRGAGRAEATFVLERLVDMGSRELGLEPVALRRRNLIPHRASPGRPAGDPGGSLAKALEIVGYEALRKEQSESRRRGQNLGIGVACYASVSGAPELEAGAAPGSGNVGARVEVTPTGRAIVHVGPASTAEGEETTLAQIAAAGLGVPLKDVSVEQGDTSASPFAIIGAGIAPGPALGAVVWRAAAKVEAAAREVAAALLSIGPADVTRDDRGAFVNSGGGDLVLSMGDVAAAACGAEALAGAPVGGLEATAFDRPAGGATVAGTHIAVVEVDVDTGEVSLIRYIAVDDCGRVVHPRIVEDRIRGGVAQGIAQALWEGIRYDRSGRLVTRSLESYPVARAARLPHIEVSRLETAMELDPLALGSTREAGPVAAPAAVTNAVLDALDPFGIRHLDMPLTSETVWLAIRDAAGGG